MHILDSLGWQGGDFAFSASFVILNTQRNYASRRAAAGAAHGPGAGLGVWSGPALPRLGGRLVARYFVLCTVLYCTVLYCTVLYCTGFLVTALGSALAGLAILAFPATISRHQQLQQRGPASSSAGLGGTVAATLANPLYLLIRYCTVLYCTVLYCTVLCTGQPRRGQRQSPDRGPCSFPAQVR